MVTNYIHAKFPTPIVDEFLDELYGSCYFSKLDFKFGYHQIIIIMEEFSRLLFTLLGDITSSLLCLLA